jgi:hypothetical protein
MEHNQQLYMPISGFEIPFFSGEDVTYLKVNTNCHQTTLIMAH